MKAFRAEEAAHELQQSTINYLTRSLPPEGRERARWKIEDLITQHGLVVESYPSWHPLVSSGEKDRYDPCTRPSNGRAGYRGLDHTCYLRNAMITCPYTDGEEIIKSVQKLNPPRGVTITATKIDVPLYAPTATPILIACEWERPLASDGTIPPSLAVPLLLEMELPNWRTSEVAETWETMRRYFLGQPCGSRSSLFVNQETGQLLKTLWNTLINTGMFGPIYVG